MIMNMSKDKLLKSLLLFIWFLKRKFILKTIHTSSLKPKYPPNPNKLKNQILVFDMEGSLMRSSSTFPYFMLVALETSFGLLRGLVLLLLYPIIFLCGHELGVKIMVMVSFFGVRVEEGFKVGKGVLPKCVLEGVGLEGFEVVRSAKRRVCVTSMPRVMVEEVLREYLGVEEVVARELKVFNGYYTGLLMDFDDDDHVMEVVNGNGEEEEEVVWFGGEKTSCLHRQFFSFCKEMYNSPSEVEKKRWHPLPRAKYTKPLIFHDGRLAFNPTPSATLSMFIWLPFAFVLAVLRMLIGYFVHGPYIHSLFAFLGSYVRLFVAEEDPSTKSNKNNNDHVQLYICNHRTLVDPLYIGGVLGSNVIAATYSLSRFSELISPIKTIRLTRDRDEDKRRMKGIVESNKALVVCPEGTTCREPYLLRFSPLFAELCDAVTPVALETHVTMFYGTSTSVFKFLDPFYFFMNPWPYYEVECLDTVVIDHSRNSIEVANYVQSEIGRVLGFECTSLTRRDKYMMLAGNEGIVNSKRR